MTKKHFIAIADVIVEQIKHKQMKQTGICDWVAFCEEQNKNFDAGKFEQYIEDRI